MAREDWEFPQTEEGLQACLRRLETAQTAGDHAEIGYGLLALAFLVKWVRSDTALPPFVRAQELQEQAIEEFRQSGDKKGLAGALVSGSGMIDPGTRERRLEEAERLAEEIGDDDLRASVIAGRARALALSDRDGATLLHREALEIYRRTGNQAGQARCLFGLSISEGTAEEKRDFALEGARLYRETGDPGMASKCAWLALMNAEQIEPLASLEGLVREGLKDAQDAGKHSQERSFYEKLALIAVATGRHEEAERYRRWANEIQESDGLTPLERWKGQVAMTKTMIGMVKAQGQKEAVKEFQAELKRLKAAKPKK